MIIGLGPMIIGLGPIVINMMLSSPNILNCWMNCYMIFCFIHQITSLWAYELLVLLINPKPMFSVSTLLSRFCFCSIELGSWFLRLPTLKSRTKASPHLATSIEFGTPWLKTQCVTSCLRWSCKSFIFHLSHWTVGWSYWVHTFFFTTPN